MKSVEALAWVGWIGAAVEAVLIMFLLWLRKPNY